MRVTPGTQIPFWLKLWDGNPSRFIVAHLTDLNGLEQPGSPYILSYSGNRGIYVGLGPVMGISDLRADYEVFLDSGLTQTDRAHLPSWEDIISDVSVSYALSQILGKLANVDPNTVVGYIDQSYVQGTVDAASIGGQVIISETQGTIDNTEVEQGMVDTTTITGGVL